MSGSVARKDAERPKAKAGGTNHGGNVLVMGMHRGTRARRDRKSFNREDLLAVPLCILWGIGMMAWSATSFDPWTLMSSADGSSSMGAIVAFLSVIPKMLAKYFFG